MKKILFAFSLAFAGAKSATAQDTIILVNGFQLPAKVIEIGVEKVQYKKWNDVSSTLYMIDKPEVYMIRFENGTQSILNNLNEKRNNSSAGNEDSPFRSKYNGPRVGFTVMGDGTSADYMNYQGKQPVITQFGWQFETRFFKTPDGLSGLLELVPMVGGMEQGEFLPSASLLVGLRSEKKNCIEFGLGPNVSKSGLGMIFAAGTSLRSGNVYFPVTLSFLPSINKRQNYIDAGVWKSKIVKSGFKISLTVGFNARRINKAPVTI